MMDGRLKLGLLRVAETLLRDWDPMGISQRPGASPDPAEEYGDCARGAYFMVLKGATERQLVSYLMSIEESSLGRSHPNMGSARRTAEALVALRPLLRLEAWEVPAFDLELLAAAWALRDWRLVPEDIPQIVSHLIEHGLDHPKAREIAGFRRLVPDNIGDLLVGMLTELGLWPVSEEWAALKLDAFSARQLLNGDFFPSSALPTHCERLLGSGRASPRLARIAAIAQRFQGCCGSRGERDDCRCAVARLLLDAIEGHPVGSVGGAP